LRRRNSDELYGEAGFERKTDGGALLGRTNEGVGLYVVHWLDKTVAEHSPGDFR
jgi:hypothetical protein